MDQSVVDVEVSGLAWGVRDRTILSDVNLAVTRGEFVALVGPNGSGKTSLLRCLYRYHRPVSGYVRICGEDIWRSSAPRVAQLVAALTQESPDAFEFTVGDVVMLGRIPYKRGFAGTSKRDRETVHGALELVSADHLVGRLFSTLSGGEKQRVLVARALAQEPDVLILDEPTNNLDARHQFEVLELMRSLPQTKIAALHDLPLAAAYCSRVCVLDNGSLVADGPSWETLTPELIERVFGVSAEVASRGEDGSKALILTPQRGPGPRTS
jgi:iron complex transport system ATP-binding protein